MDYTIFDMETDGLIETVTKFHCLCGLKKVGDITYPIVLRTPEEIKIFFVAAISDN